MHVHMRLKALFFFLSMCIWKNIGAWEYLYILFVHTIVILRRWYGNSAWLIFKLIYEAQREKEDGESYDFEQKILMYRIIEIVHL